MSRARCVTWVGYSLAALALLAGLALRLTYALQAGPYIDEFTTIWAARQVLIGGLPRFPAGAVYTQGLLYTYLDALALLLASGFSPFVARLPSLALSLLTLALLVYAARRLFPGPPFGLAALWLALDSQAILWGGRARTYALLQLLVLLAFLAWYRGAVAGDRPRARWAAIGLLLLALVDQPLILLLLPPFALLALMARGWDWLRQPVVWVQAGAVAVAVAARWLLYGLMVPQGAIPAAAPRSFVDLTHPLAGAKDLLLPFLTAPNRLLPALLVGVGLIWLLLKGPGRRGLPWKRPFLSLLFPVFFVWFEFLFLIGVSWRAPRYLFPLLPFFFLAAEGVAGGLYALSARRRWAWPLLVGLLALSFAAAVPSARRAATRHEWGYDRALAFVEAGWAEGDALATIAPAAAFAQLGHCDYLAVEEGAQALVFEENGRRVDAWTGLPLLDSPRHLAEALDAHAHLWFVADEMRLNRHFSPAYLHLLWGRSDLLAFEGNVFVFRSRPAESPPAVDRSFDRPAWEGPVVLAGFALSDDRPRPGETLTVTLRWRSGKVASGEPLTAFVHLVNRGEEGVAGHDAPLLGGLYPVERWPRSDRSQPFPDRYSLALPADLPPDRYRLDVGLYDSRTLEEVVPRLVLDFVRVGGYEEPLPPGPPLGRFGDAVTLYLGGLVGEMKPGGEATLNLVWQVGPAALDDDYTLFLHLLDAEGEIVQQFDAPPVGGWYPTGYWHPGEVVGDEHRLAFDPALEPGIYRLVGGLYRADGRRLPLGDGGDTVEIAVIALRP